MCDYSLHFTASRPARVGDKLVTTAFANSTTRGLCALDEPHSAVCLLPGTEIAFDNEVEYSSPFGLLLKVRIADRLARFRQIDKDRADVHHDALEFSSGGVVLVHWLCQGQRLTVLQMPSARQAKQEEIQRVC